MPITYIHYGADCFEPARVKLPETCLMSKPDGGLWACRQNAHITWKTWCEKEQFRVEQLEKHFTFTLAQGTRLLTIRRPQDLKPYLITTRLWSQLDLPSLLSDYDGMELLLPDQSNFSSSSLFNVWDINSLCVWRAEAIVPAHH